MVQRIDSDDDRRIEATIRAIAEEESAAYNQGEYS